MPILGYIALDTVLDNTVQLFCCWLALRDDVGEGGGSWGSTNWSPDRNSCNCSSRTILLFFMLGIRICLIIGMVVAVISSVVQLIFADNHEDTMLVQTNKTNLQFM